MTDSDKLDLILSRLDKISGLEKKVEDINNAILVLETECPA